MRQIWICALLLLAGAMTWAQDSPWVSIVASVETEFGQPLGPGLSDADYSSEATASGAPVASRKGTDTPSFALPFGNPAQLAGAAREALETSTLGRYRSPAAQYGIRSEKIFPLLAGQSVYFQQSATKFQGTGILPSDANAAAVLHDNGYVSIYSASAPLLFDMNKMKSDGEDALGLFVGFTSATSVHYCSVRVYDCDKKVWVNPSMFLPFKTDTKAPKILSLALVNAESGRPAVPSGDGAATRTSKKSKAPTAKTAETYSQGNYSLAIRALDTVSGKELKSGLYRFRLVVDGQVLFDRRLDKATAEFDGLSFMEEKAPSSSTVNIRGAFLVGSYFFAAGIHNLELTAYDYAGNYARLNQKIQFR